MIFCSANFLIRYDTKATILILGPDDSCESLDLIQSYITSNSKIINGCYKLSSQRVMVKAT